MRFEECVCAIFVCYNLNYNLSIYYRETVIQISFFTYQKFLHVIICLLHAFISYIHVPMYFFMNLKD